MLSPEPILCIACGNDRGWPEKTPSSDRDHAVSPILSYFPSCQATWGRHLGDIINSPTSPARIVSTKIYGVGIGIVICAGIRQIIRLACGRPWKDGIPNQELLLAIE